MRNKNSLNLARNDPRAVTFPALEEAYIDSWSQEAGPQEAGPQNSELTAHACELRALLLEASEHEIQAALAEALGMSRQTRAQRRRYLAHLRPRPWEETDPV